MYFTKESICNTDIDYRAKLKYISLQNIRISSVFNEIFFPLFYILVFFYCSSVSLVVPLLIKVFGPSWLPTVLNSSMSVL